MALAYKFDMNEALAEYDEYLSSKVTSKGFSGALWVSSQSGTIR